jgi:DNA-directed RNA polymerase subunit alpha
MKIEDIDFSVRAYHCLKHAGIDTIEKLISLTEKDLNKIRNLGEKHKTEVINKVNDLGFEFNKHE